MEKRKQPASRQRSKIRNVALFAGKCPFPTVAVNASGEVTLRNPLAERRLPALHRLRRILSGWLKKDDEERMFSALIGKECWFVLMLPAAGARLFVFLEDLTLHRESIFREMLLEGAELLEEWKSLGVDFDPKGESSPAVRSRLAARTQRMQERMQTAGRLHSVIRRKRDVPCSCGIKGFLDLVAEKLREARLGFTVKGGEGNVAYVSPNFLLKAILFFARFALLSGTETEMTANSQRKGKEVEIVLSVPRRKNVLRSFADPDTLEQEEALPLISLAGLCREWETEFSLADDGENLLLTLRLPSCEAEPQMFLGTRSRKETQMVEKTVREILFLNKKR